MCRPLAKIRICETIYDILLIGLLQYQVSTTVMGLVVVFASFVFMLALLCFCVATVFSVTKDLYTGAYHTTHFHRDSRKMQKNQQGEREDTYEPQNFVIGFMKICHRSLYSRGCVEGVLILSPPGQLRHRHKRSYALVINGTDVFCFLVPVLCCIP